MASTRGNRDFEALERRRLQAAALLEQGIPQADVARRFSVAPQSVSRWSKALAQRGLKGLRRMRRPGRTAHLTLPDLGRLQRALQAGPEAHGYTTGLWTLGRIVQLIETQCGIRYGKTRVWQLLQVLGWSYQRPTGQAWQRDEPAIRDWQRTQWLQYKIPTANPEPGLRRQVGRERVRSGADAGATFSGAYGADGSQSADADHHVRWTGRAPEQPGARIGQGH